jgi:hypothetical protein
LRDDAPRELDKQSVPEPPPIQFRDPLEVWRAEADEASRRRELADAERHRQERKAEAARLHVKQASELAIEARLASLEERVGDLETELAQLAGGSLAFSEAATSGINKMHTLAAKLESTLTTLKFTHERECKYLRDRLADSEAMRARETALTSRQLSEAQRTIDRLTEREVTHSELEVVNSNVVELHRATIAARAADGD